MKHIKYLSNFKHIKFFCLFIGLLLVFGSLWAEEEFKTVRLNDRALILMNGPWEETMVVVDAGAELVVIDTWSSPVMAEKAMAYIAKTFNKPVTYVINTHHHWDHTFGNQVFKGATIVGHKFCVEDMKADYGDEAMRLKHFSDLTEQTPDPAYKTFYTSVKDNISSGFQLTLPTRLVDDREDLRIGDLTFKLYHSPGLHTRSLLTVFIPELGMLFTRKNFHNHRRPMLDLDADIPKIIGILEDVLATGQPVKYILAGHNSPLLDPDLKVTIKRLGEISKIDWKLDTINKK